MSHRKRKISSTPKHPEKGFKGEWGPQDPSSSLHDLVIKRIAEYLEYDDETLNALIRVSKRFHAMRDIFYGHIHLNTAQSERLYRTKPSGWNKVAHMSLTSCPDISELGQIKFLMLSNLPSTVQDFSPLRKVKCLFLSRCQYLTDLSTLSSIESLSIDCSPNIRDISPLRGVKALSIHTCHGITNFPDIGYVETFSLYWSHITDVTAFKGVCDLNFWECDQLSDVSPLKDVHGLFFCRCHKITDVSALGGVQKLCFYSCDGISDISALSNVKVLKINGCRLIAHNDPY